MGSGDAQQWSVGGTREPQRDSPEPSEAREPTMRHRGILSRLVAGRAAILFTAFHVCSP